MKNNKYIVLYADEFKVDVWARYMDVLGLAHTELEVKIIIEDVIRLNK